MQSFLKLVTFFGNVGDDKKPFAVFTQEMNEMRPRGTLLD